jgi:hypothetical protein
MTITVKIKHDMVDYPLSIEVVRADRAGPSRTEPPQVLSSGQEAIFHVWGDQFLLIREEKAKPV